jgi:glutathione S-transferase
MHHALEGRNYLLGETFSMADVVFGGTIRYMLMFKMLDPDPTFEAYAERLAQRPALVRANARNAEVVEKRGLGRG